MKKLYLSILMGMLCAFLSNAQPTDLVLSTPESGTVVHYATNSITFAPGYSYTPNGGSLKAEIVEPMIAGDIIFSPAIDPDNYSINTSLDVGKIPGALAVKGAAGYTIPIDIPGGTNNLQPNISLNYTSQFADGILGIGWNLGGISSITRVKNTIYHDGKSDVIKGDINDKYALDGKRLIVTSGSYGAANSEYRTEIEEFSKVIAYGSAGAGPEWFNVYTKSGLIYEFGNTDDSKIEHNNGCILSWRVNKISDRYNNYITFSYIDIDDEHPIWKIEYTGNSSMSQSPFAQILFTYKNRDDVSRYYYGGEEFTRDILLDNIEIKNNGQSFKKYEFTYMKDANAQLQKVSEYSSQNAALNPMVFAWTEQTDQFTQTIHYTGSTYEINYIGDFNGDGRDDLVSVPDKTSYSTSDKWKLYLADASGNMVYETEGNLNSYFEAFKARDFNGDGLTDLMMQEKHPFNPTYPNRKHYLFYQSDGSSFTRSTTYYTCYNDERLDIIDYNGDGKLEFLFHNTDNHWYLYTYSGQSIYSSSIPSFGEYYIEDKGMKNRILDFNGDGCSDLLTLFSDGYKIYEFKGTNDVLIETYSGDNIDNNDFLLFGDYNGDGTTDIIKKNAYVYYEWYIQFLTTDGFQDQEIDCFDYFDINVGNNRIYAREMNGDGKTDVVLVGRGESTSNSYDRINVAISSGDDFNITEYTSSTTMQNGYDRYFQFGDYNGDGRFQLFYKYSSTSKLFSFASGTPGHLVRTIIDGLETRTDLTYLPMSNSNVYTRGSGATYPVSDFSSPIQLVSQVTSDNGIGGTNSVSYEYSGAKVHRQGKGFLGFSQVTATNSATGISTESNYAFDDTYYYPQLTSIYTKHGSSPMSTVVNIWDEEVYVNKRIFPYISSTTKTDNLKNLSVTSTAGYDTYGNPTSVAKDFGGGHTQTTSYSYNDERVSDWLIGRPTTITETSVRDSQTETFTTARSYFSSNNSPDIDQYNSGDASYWKLDREYDGYGNLWKEHKETTGLSTLTTIYDYDSQGLNLQKLTDPTGNETNYTYDSGIGLINTQTDPFGNQTTYYYNSSDQLSSVVPDGGIATTFIRSLDVTGGPANARYYEQETGSDGSQTKTWYDKLGRELRNETKNIDGSMVKVDKQYNSKGQLYRVSEPSTGTPSNWNIIGYDDKGRVNSQDPYYGATTTFTYGSATTTKTVNSRIYTSTVDAAGLVTQRSDPGGSVTYNYRADGLLKSTLAPGNVTTAMTYDKNSNRLTIADPSSGTITNTWYGTGQIKTLVNGRGQTTTYTYQPDGLLDKYVTSAEGETNYSYNSDGQVSSISTPDGVSRSYTYDSRRRLSSISESISGVSNTVTFNYDSQGRLYRKYFNGTDYEQYDYNLNGYLYRILFNGSTVWQLNSMDEYGHITQATIGSTGCTWGYDSNKLLSQINASGVQRYDYSFDANTGNLNSRTNFLKSKSESFGYDTAGLDRLASVTGPSAMTLNYQNNNENGNINSKSDAGTYAYDDTPYAVSSIENAQNISTTPQTIDYYSFEKVKKITEGSKTAEFVYNSDNQRIRMALKNNGTPTKTRWYFGSSCEREEVGGVVTQYIWIGGDAYSAVAVAKKVGTGSWTVYNIFRDHLGTITHLKNAGTGIVDEYSFEAWGRRRDKDTWSYSLSGEPALFAGRGFTAHEHLEDFNLINMNGRLYDPVVGRFLSPDPFVPGVDFTQGFNRYSYALNNPLSYSDPDGEFPWAFVIINAWIHGMRGLSAAVSDNPHGSFGDYLLGWAKGAFIGGLSGWAGAYSSTIIGTLPGIGFGSATGAGLGALDARAFGGDVGQQALWGGVSGGIFGGFSGYSNAELANELYSNLGIDASVNVWTGKITTSNYYEYQFQQNLWAGTSSSNNGYNDYTKGPIDINKGDRPVGDIFARTKWLSESGGAKSLHEIVTPQFQTYQAAGVPYVFRSGTLYGEHSYRIRQYLFDKYLFRTDRYFYNIRKGYYFGNSPNSRALGLHFLNYSRTPLLSIEVPTMVGYNALRKYYRSIKIVHPFDISRFLNR